MSRSRLGVLEDVLDLLGLEPGVDRARDGAERPDREVRPDEVGAVEAQDAHPRAVPDAALGQYPGGRGDATAHLRVAEGLAGLGAEEERRIGPLGYPLGDQRPKVGMTRLRGTAETGLDHRPIVPSGPPGGLLAGDLPIPDGNARRW